MEDSLYNLPRDRGRNGESMGAEVKELSPYQVEGAEFLSARSHALIADEPGVGKTAQLITAADMVGARKILVICPAVARVNWLRELQEWSIFSYDFKVCLKLSDEPTENCIVSFDYARENFELLKGIPWDLVIVDESHFIKEPEAAITQRIYGKKGIVRVSDRLWCASGTPAPNHAGELWPLLFTFGRTNLPYEDFIDQFCETRPTFYGGRREVKVCGTKKDKIPEIKALLSPVMIRRRKQDVLKDLKIPTFETLTVEGTSLPEVLEMDRMVLNRENSMLNESIAVAGDQLAYVLEKIGKSVSTLRRYTGLMKTKNVCEIVKSELSSNAYQKIVIFAYHTEVIANVKRELEEFGAVVVNGKVSDKDRQTAIDSFQNDPKTRVFIGNVKSAGTAITLTASQEVLLLEQSWVPGENSQAIDRCYRRGQAGTVRVRVATLFDSLDEKVNKVLIRKIKDLTEIFNTQEK
jgi:SWI/SNF-related matrix-associated actin-dependent regulator 1 of chromatin subfamily A